MLNQEDYTMAQVPLKCPKCGRSIQLDDQQETCICEYCGSQFAFQEAARKYMAELAGKLTPSGIPASSTEPIPGYDLPEKTVLAIRLLVANKQKIEAIKLFRENTDTGLKEAKDAIDSLDLRQPQRNSSTGNTSPGSRTDDPSLKVSKCYIATAVYGSYDAPEVLVLRRFRDEVLSKSMPGRAFIRSYYAVSPPVARRLENAGRINRLVRRMLDKIVHRLDTGSRR